MVTHKHASDELSQQTVTDSRFARPNHQSCFGKWWFATPNREPFAVWGSKPPKLLRPVVAWHGRPRSFGGLGCQTVAIWWSGRKTVFFGGLPTQTTTDHIDCGGLQWQTTKVHWLLHQTTKTQIRCSRSCHPNHQRPFGLWLSAMANHHNSQFAAPNN